IRIGHGACRDRRASHTTANGNATTVCLYTSRRRLWRFRLWLRSRKEIDKGGPKSRRHNDQPASEPPENLLVALVTQETPQPICAFELALGNVGLRRKIGCNSSGEVTFPCTSLIRLPFETADQSVHIILK